MVSGAEFGVRRQCVIVMLVFGAGFGVELDVLSCWWCLVLGSVSDGGISL